MDYMAHTMLYELWHAQWAKLLKEAKAKRVKLLEKARAMGTVKNGVSTLCIFG
ncbi:hypothetical protein CsSME_00015887 [Camellia sinensis var. sinensis]